MDMLFLINGIANQLTPLMTASLSEASVLSIEEMRSIIQFDNSFPQTKDIYKYPILQSKDVVIDYDTIDWVGLQQRMFEAWKGMANYDEDQLLVAGVPFFYYLACNEKTTEMFQQTFPDCFLFLRRPNPYRSLIALTENWGFDKENAVNLFTDTLSKMAYAKKIYGDKLVVMTMRDVYSNEGIVFNNWLLKTFPQLSYGIDPDWDVREKRVRKAREWLKLEKSFESYLQDKNFIKEVKEMYVPYSSLLQELNVNMEDAGIDL